MQIQTEPAISIDRLPDNPRLPDPFVFLDGSRVRTRDDWERRRAEIQRVVQEYAYGPLPPAGGPVIAEEMPAEAIPSFGNGSSDSAAKPSSVPAGSPSAEEQHLRLRMGPQGSVSTRLILSIPAGSGPFPAIIRGDLGWGRADPSIVAAVTGRGYLLAEFDRTEIVPDAADQTGGLYAAYPGQPFGALAAWAWGFGRVVDYLRGRADVDAMRIAVTGHSRGGKAALLAGALDERIALTAPNNSGCMGAGCTRFPHDGETLERITQVFPCWFGSRAAAFVGREGRLPFDQHSLKALVAPRALLSTEGMEDHWANPPGTQLTHQAAKAVFDFLGAGDRIGVVFRSGGHAHSLADWEALLDFADWQLLGKERAREFGDLPYPDISEQAFSW